MATDVCGSIYPPRSAEEVLAYDSEAITKGYLRFSPSQADPGVEHSPSYRWGWKNAKRDFLDEPDGFDWVRLQVIEYRSDDRMRSGC